MRATPGSRVVLPALMAALLAGAGGCGLVTVEMTSSPPTVRSGDPVTFDIKLTNQSPCPLDTTVAILVPFISQGDINVLFSDVPPDAPPEILEFIQALREFLDALCAGGQPTPPTPPAIAAAAVPPDAPGLNAGCHVGDGAIECEFSLRVRENGNGMSFDLFGGRVKCEVDDEIVRCRFEIPLPEASKPLGVTSTVVEPLNCFTPEQLGLPPDIVAEELGEIGALCFVGMFPMIHGLGPNDMATGQITLPARGSGVMRNFIIAISDEPEDAGVCKGGSDAGEPCDLDFGGDCTGGTCSPGICDGGDNDGEGCDVAADCPNGGTCLACEAAIPIGALPIDCTTTYVSPEPAPVASPWGLAGLALALVATGSYWLQRRHARR